jgi:hypothetical protein
MVEHGEKFGLVGVQPLEQAIKTDEAGVTAEDVVEPCAELSAAPRCRRDAIVFQIGVELPDPRAHMLRAARWWSVNVSSLCTSLSAWIQHSAC